MSLIHLNFQSKYLSGNTDVNLILPDLPRGREPGEFYGSGERYKVLWLLHGTFGDYTDWIRKSNVELYASEKNLAVVMPSAQNTDYANWEGFGLGYRMYDYLTEELMPMVYGWLPVSDKRTLSPDFPWVAGALVCMLLPTLKNSPPPTSCPAVPRTCGSKRMTKPGETGTKTGWTTQGDWKVIWPPPRTPGT